MSRLDQLLEMLKADPNDSFLNYALALEYAKEFEIEKAIELIEQLLERDEKYLGAYYQLGKFHEQTGRFTKAADTYRKGIQIGEALKNKKAVGELKEALWMLEED